MEDGYGMTDIDWVFVEGIMALEEYMKAVMTEDEVYMEAALCNYKSCEIKYKAMSGFEFPKDIKRDFEATHQLDKRIIASKLEKDMDIIDEMGNDDVCLDMRLTPRDHYAEQDLYAEEEHSNSSFIPYSKFN